MARHMTASAAFDAWQRQHEAEQDRQELAIERDGGGGVRGTAAASVAAVGALYVVLVRRQGRMRWVRVDGSTTPVRSDAAALSAQRASETAQRVSGEMERV